MQWLVGTKQLFLSIVVLCYRVKSEQRKPKISKSMKNFTTVKKKKKKKIFHFNLYVPRTSQSAKRGRKCKQTKILKNDKLMKDASFNRMSTYCFKTLIIVYNTFPIFICLFSGSHTGGLGGNSLVVMVSVVVVIVVIILLLVVIVLARKNSRIWYSKSKFWVT